MVLDLLLYALAGVAAGIITGLLPGLHNNTLAALLLGATLSGAIPADSLHIAAFIVAMGVANSFVEFVPGIFLGVPDPDVSLAVSPAQRLVLKGRGAEAVNLTIFGGFLGVAVLFAAAPLLILAVPQFYELLRPNMPLVLVCLMSVMIAVEKRRLAALTTFLLSGAFGLVSFGMPVNKNYVLLPMLAGLFGLSAKLFRAREHSVHVEKKNYEFQYKDATVGGVLGFFGGILAGLLPGFGSAQAAVLLQYLGRLRNARVFLAAQGAINSTNILLSIVALYLIGNPRSGSAVAIQNIIPSLDLQAVVLFLFVGLVSAVLAAAATCVIGKWAAEFASGKFSGKIEAAVVLFLLAMIAMLTGPLGITVAAAGTAIGALPHLFGVKKSLCMGSLIVPTILFFLGF